MNEENIINMAQPTKYESNELNELYSALCKAQGEMETANTDKNNPFFKSRYADLTSITKASRPYLTKNGLSIIQRIVSNGNDKMYMLTRLCHTSGQWIESKMPINPVKTDIQSIGSYITYVRRYTLSAIIGIAVDDANDDDGEKAMNRKVDTEAEKEIDSDKLKNIQIKLKKLSEITRQNIVNKIFSYYKIKELNEIKNKNYASIINEINKELINVPRK